MLPAGSQLVTVVVTSRVSTQRAKKVGTSDSHLVCKWNACTEGIEGNTTSARCKAQDTRCKVQGQHQCRLVQDAATTCNYNHHHHVLTRLGPAQHDAAIKATSIRARFL